jgi:hypothetical protein
MPYQSSRARSSTLFSHAKHLIKPFPIVLRSWPAEISGASELRWRQIGSLSGQRYPWRAERGVAHEFHRFDLLGRGDGLELGIGYDLEVDGEPRRIGVFRMRAGGYCRKPIGYFVRTDQFAATGEMFTPIRGLNGKRTYFARREFLPSDYDGKDVRRAREVSLGSHLKSFRVLVVHKDDWQTMAEHAAIQIHIRGLRPDGGGTG